LPVYEYYCKGCKRKVSVLVRRAEDEPSACPHCNGRELTRVVSGFAFHKSLRSKVEQLDPRYEKEIDASNPDLSMESLTRKYGLDRPLPEPDKE
jgi:putative FmdB family regulatory protein